VRRLDALARGELTPPPARRAATVVLLRDAAAPGGVEAYLLRRAASMAFAAGAYAFPGGSVDPRDAEAAPRWAGPSPEEWGERLGVPAEDARAVVCAAVRETFEECGVLLAGPDAASVVADVSGPDWAAARAALEARELSFGEFLAREGLVLRSDLLGAWSRWITPEWQDRRFDTWFFVAALPEGQRAAETVGEADRVEWLPPQAAVAAYESGEFSMLPPTAATLRELTPCGSVAEAVTLAGKRAVRPVQGVAEALPGAGGYRLTWPGYPEFTMEGSRGAGRDGGSA
jgi:8-oxo-dGTP pyrophosphatase MutT (NUDIX family)